MAEPAVELAVLQTIRLKGRSTPAALREALEPTGSRGAGHRDPGLSATLTALTEAGLLTGGDAVRLSESGLSRCQALLTAERSRIDTATMAAVYGRFQAINTEFKALVTDWQLSHDRGLLEDLPRIHRDVARIIDEAAEQVPRLAGYGIRLGRALDRINSGDTGWLTRPLADSYHTVWFELHEELIGASGRSRGDDE